MKKVFIGVLAALMLFAFTACENNAPQTPIMGNQIEGVELVSAPDYIIGIDDDIDPAKVELNVIKNDGSKVSYTGTELNLKAPTTLSTINNCAVTYGNLTFYVNIPAYNWDEITAVDLSGATTKTIKTTDTTISTDGITVTVSYAKGTRSGVAIGDVVKNGDEITFSENKTVADFGYKDGQKINIEMCTYCVDELAVFQSVDAQPNAFVRCLVKVNVLIMVVYGFSECLCGIDKQMGMGAGFVFAIISQAFRK